MAGGFVKKKKMQEESGLGLYSRAGEGRDANDNARKNNEIIKGKRGKKHIKRRRRRRLEDSDKGGRGGRAKTNKNK